MLKLKRIVLIVCILCGMSGVMTPIYASEAAKDKNTQNTKGPAIVFAEKQYNFGFVPEKGGPVSHTFEFTNKGDAPLVIISATASCGCTRPTYPTEPIAPGKKGKIKVTYLPDGRPGEFNKVIKVRTNAKDSKKISLQINGTVTSK